MHRFQVAWHACELPDWSSEATFLRVLQPAIRDERAASYVLRFFENKPEVQRYLARLILRRAVDPRTDVCEYPEDHDQALEHGGVPGAGKARGIPHLRS